MITCKTLGREQHKKSLVLKDKMQLLSTIRLKPFLHPLITMMPHDSLSQDPVVSFITLITILFFC